MHPQPTQLTAAEKEEQNNNREGDTYHLVLRPLERASKVTFSEQVGHAPSLPSGDGVSSMNFFDFYSTQLREGPSQ
jgi:hypothetical protein